MSPDFVHVLAVVLAIGLLVVLIARFKFYPFVALIIATLGLGLLGGLKPDEVIKNFEQGFGDVLSFVGVVIGLGTMLGGAARGFRRRGPPRPSPRVAGW